MDRTLILVKPDAFARGLTGEILARFERKGLTIVALEKQTLTRETAETHYAEHSERPFFGELVDFITSGPLVAAVLEGHEAVKAARQVIGATNPLEAATGSIRGDFALEVGQNMVHGSDSNESAAREAAIFFPEPGLSEIAAAARLVLASRSPQRRAILAQLGIPFDAVVPDVEELTSGDPIDVAGENARLKAEAVAPSPLPVIGVDTIVALHGTIYGKPASADEAREVLERLDGRVHEVVSGLAVARRGKVRRVSLTTTRVHFRPLDAATIDWYVSTGEWRERAGGYAIQGRGAALVQQIEGDYLNVVGLPVTALLAELPGILQDGS